MFFEKDLQLLMCDGYVFSYGFKPKIKPNFVEDHQWIPGERYLEIEVDHTLSAITEKLTMFSYN
jgi:hypothetical protein